MKILLAGAWEYPIYEEACAEALRDCGVGVVPFRWGDAFRGLPGKVERHWVLPGPVTCALNRRLLEAAGSEHPDVVWLWRATSIFPKTLRSLREQGFFLLAYNNDDPMSPAYTGSRRLYERRMWRWFNESIPDFDLQLVFRPINLAEYRERGARRVELLRAYYRDSVDRPLELSGDERDRFGCDVVFAGHFENDMREECLRRLGEGPASVRLFGDPTWQKGGAAERLSGLFPEIAPVYGEDYVKALNGAKLALCFLSKRHRDSYTRRCFEIPACGTVLLSERTEDLQTLFREDEEAVFFDSAEELNEKVSWLLSDDDARESIAKQGRERVQEDGHGVGARMRWLAGELEDALQ